MVGHFIRLVRLYSKHIRIIRIEYIPVMIEIMLTSIWVIELSDMRAISGILEIHNLWFGNLPGSKRLYPFLSFFTVIRLY